VIAVLAALLSQSAPALAQGRRGDRTDPLAGARRLRQAAASLAPLPDSGSGITRDVGSIAIIEHDGSNYDKDDAEGQPNYAARASVALRFYQTHGDLYDFLVVFTNFEFATGEAVAFHNLVRNGVAGIGKPITDSGASFGSPGRLLGYVDMAAVARYRQPGFSLQPGDPAFLATLAARPARRRRHAAADSRSPEQRDL
jgi:hypothetical protein